MFYILAVCSPAISVYIIFQKDIKTKGLRYFLRFALTPCRMLLALLLFAAFAAIRFLIPLFFGDVSVIGSWQQVIAFIPAMLFFGGLEEIGWRGYLQPKLENRFGFIAATLIFVVIWILWHIPLSFIQGTYQHSGNYYWFIVSLAGSAFSYSAIMRVTGNIFVCILFHATANAIISSGISIQNGFGVAISVILQIILAITIVFWHGRRISMRNTTIRLEEPHDHRAVEELTRAAFNTPDRVARSKIGCPLEHYMVHQLRKKDGIMHLNFVAEIDGKIVGHIIYSHAHVLRPDGTKVDVLNFGPISVAPKMQKMGIGSALMMHSIKEAKRLGYGAILFFGHPLYYPRFGFVPASKFDITDSGGENYPAFMAMELTEGYLNNASGRFIEADIYNDDLNREQAKDFDKSFSDTM